LLEQPAGQPGSFKKFGPTAKDLEVLSGQVLWRLQLQKTGNSDDPLLQSFKTRLGTDRQVEPFPPTGPGTGLSSTPGYWSLMQSSAQIGSYQPLVHFGGMNGTPKMDVDFSGFETHVIFSD